MGKLIVAFSMFLAASALAIHESKPPAPPPDAIAPATPAEPVTIDHTPPSRAIHDEVPPWVKYAAPATPPPPRTIVIETPPPPRIIIEESSISYDIPDSVDRCPDSDNTDDNDGCPDTTARDVDERTVTMIY